MNNEQLQIILGALQGLGAAGKDAFIWWLVFDKGLPVVGWLLSLVGIALVIRMVIGTFSASSYLAQVRDELGIGSPGPVHDCEAVAVLRKVCELHAKSKDA